MSASRSVFVSPTSVAGALEEIASGEATVLAGGTSVALLIGQRLIEPSKLVHVARIPEMRSISFDTGRRELRIGAAVTLAEIAGHAEITAALPSLAYAAGVVGNPRVRSVATVGGALAHGDPRQDLPPVLISLGAMVTLSGPGGERSLPAAALATGFMETCVAPDELITGVVIPLSARRGTRYCRFTPQSVADYPTVGVAASVSCDADGTVADAKVALAGVASTALSVDAAGLLKGVFANGSDLDSRVSEVAHQAAANAEPIDDRLGSAAYKRAMISVWTRRALLACVAG
ncbi:MAG: FAD binding domain-containing protein [Acidimicrobiales bacterium]